MLGGQEGSHAGEHLGRDLNEVRKRAGKRMAKAEQSLSGQIGSLKSSQGISEWLQRNKGENRGYERS